MEHELLVTVHSADDDEDAMNALLVNWMMHKWIADSDNKIVRVVSAQTRIEARVAKNREWRWKQFQLMRMR